MLELIIAHTPETCSSVLRANARLLATPLRRQRAPSAAAAVAAASRVQLWQSCAQAAQVASPPPSLPAPSTLLRVPPAAETNLRCVLFGDTLAFAIVGPRKKERDLQKAMAKLLSPILNYSGMKIFDEKVSMNMIADCLLQRFGYLEARLPTLLTRFYPFAESSADIFRVFRAPNGGLCSGW